MCARLRWMSNGSVHFSVGGPYSEDVDVSWLVHLQTHVSCAMLAWLDKMQPELFSLHSQSKLYREILNTIPNFRSITSHFPILAL